MNRKIIFLATTMLLLASIAIFFSSCQEDDPKPAEISNVLIKTSPLKVNYYEGDILDLSGLEITFVMNDGEIKLVTFSDFEDNDITCSPKNGTVITTEIKEVKFTHATSGQSVSLSINVNKVNVTDITIKTESSKLEYYEGDTLNMSGLVVTLFMNNEETKDIAFLDFENNGISISPLEGDILTTESTKVTITHTSTGKFVNQPITVIALEVIDILIKTAPLKTSYYEGDALDLSGLVVTLYLNNNNTQDVAFSNFESKGITCSPINEVILTLETSEVIITHTASTLSVNQSISVEKVEVTDITIKTIPTKIDYYLAETIDLSGLIVSLTFNNGDTKDVPYTEFANNDIISSPAHEARLNKRSTDITITHTISNLNTTVTISFFTLTDIDNNQYYLIKMGTQLWMAENLKTTTYNDGTPITLVTDNTTWNNLTTEAYSWYNNDQASNKDIYGAMYNWYAVETGKICPSGWHVPSDSEWTLLTDFVFNEFINAEGEALKSTNYWSYGPGKDNYGFTALPGGMRSPSFDFANQTSSGFWWTSTEYNVDEGMKRSMTAGWDNVSRNPAEKVFGFSVRCIKD